MWKDKVIRLLAIVSTLICTAVNLSLFEDFVSIYYLWAVFVCIVLLWSTTNEKKNFNFAVLGLYIACILSILINAPPSFFNSWGRFLMFFIISLLFGPMITTTGLGLFRLYVFRLILYMFIALTLLSYYLMKLGLHDGGIVSHEGIFVFSGLFSSSMVLSPVACISFLYGVFKLMNTKFLKVKIAWGFIVSSSFLALLMGGSRSAMVACLLVLLFFLFMKYRNRLFKFYRIITILFTIVIFSYPLWQDKASYVLSKFEYGISKGSTTASRDEKWGYRLREFNSSPVFGIGFASIDINIGDEYSIETGSIEPGSSWLGVLSSTGILGGVSMLLLYVNMIVNLIKRYFATSVDELLFVLSCMLFFVLHQIFEGYFLASGSLLFFTTWLVLGVANFCLFFHSKVREIVL